MDPAANSAVCGVPRNAIMRKKIYCIRYSKIILRRDFIPKNRKIVEAHGCGESTYSKNTRKPQCTNSKTCYRISMQQKAEMRSDPAIAGINSSIQHLRCNIRYDHSFSEVTFRDFLRYDMICLRALVVPVFMFSSAELTECISSSSMIECSNCNSSLNSRFLLSVMY